MAPALRGDDGGDASGVEEDATNGHLSRGYVCIDPLTLEVSRSGKATIMGNQFGDCARKSIGLA